MGETLYSMVYKTESVIPVEIGMPNFRTSNLDKENNEAERRLNLDLLDKKRGSELRYAKLPTSTKSQSTTTRGLRVDHSYLVT